MKRGKVLTLSIVAVLIMAAIISAFAFTALAEGATSEATLKIEMIQYNSSNKESGTTEVSTSSGTYADMLAIAAASETAAANSGENYRYTVTLNKDVTVTASTTITAPSNVEIIIDLSGHMMTDATAEGKNIVIDGTGKPMLFRFTGNYAEDGQKGKILKMASGSIVELSGSVDTLVRVDKLSIDYSVISTNDIFSASSGQMKIEDVTFASTEVGSTLTFAKASGGAIVEIKRSEISVGDSGEVAVSADGGKVLVASSNINATGTAISAANSSSVVTVETDITATVPYAFDSTASTVYVLGGTTNATNSTLGTGVTSEKLVFYYGTGDTAVIGVNPSSAGIESNFAFSYYSVNGSYVMSPTFTPGSSTNTHYTKVSLGSVPTSASAMFSKSTTGALQNTFASSTVTEDVTVHIMTLLTDVSVGDVYASKAFNKNYNFYLDLNGHDLTMASKQDGARNVFTYTGNMSFTLDAEGGVPTSDGKGGVTYTRGVYKLTGYQTNLLYPRQNAATGKDNTYGVTTIKNIEFIQAQKVPNGSGFIWLCSGDVFIDNIKLVTSTELLTAAPSITGGIVTFSHETATGTNAFVSNSEFILDNTKTPAGIDNADVNFCAFGTSVISRFWLNNVKTGGVAYAVRTNGDVGYIKNSTLSATDAVFTGAGSPGVYDSAIENTMNGMISDGSSSPVFYYGTGKTTIKGCESGITGNYTLEDGYMLSYSATAGAYVMKLGDGVAPTVTMPAVFSDGMVLQRNKPINIYGFCNIEGTDVSVTFNGVTKTGTTTDGRFEVTFDAMDAAWGKTIMVMADGALGATIIDDVAVGEVWAMSGQSNAMLQAMYLEDVEEYKILADMYPNLRYYSSAIAPKIEEDKVGSGSWGTVTSKNLKSVNLSAIGYVAGINLAAEFGPDVPVAVIHIARGAVRIKSFLSYDRVAELSPELKTAFDNEKVYYSTNGTWSNSKPHVAFATVMYNAMIAPLDGYTVSGVMWYQGEGDVNAEASLGKGPDGEVNTYTEWFDALHDQFRDIFRNDDLPMLVMEIAPYARSSDSYTNLSNFRNEQYEICKGKDRYLVSTSIDGFAGSSQDWVAQNFIHPAAKSAVGVRCANIILEKIYGKTLPVTSQFPMYQSSAIVGGKLTLTFDTDLCYFYGKSVQGFEVYNGSAWVSVSGTISGKTVTLETEGATPTKVRYGYGNVVLQFSDGRALPIESDWSQTDTTITVKPVGSSEGITITADDGTLIRSMNPGNITNESGVPMAAFEATVG